MPSRSGWGAPHSRYSAQEVGRGPFQTRGRSENPESPGSIANARRCRRPTTSTRLTAPPFQIATRISRLTARSSRSTATEIQIMAIESRLTTIRSRVTTRNSPDKRPASRVPGYLPPFFAAGSRRQHTEITWVSSQTMGVKPEFLKSSLVFPAFKERREARPVRGRLRHQPMISVSYVFCPSAVAPIWR